MATLDEEIAQRLSEWESSGELRSAPSFGKPLAVADGYDETPVELRLAFKVLKDAGLVTQGRDAQWRPCHLEPTRLRDVSSWVDQYRRLWEARFERLDAYLRELQQEPPADRDADHPTA